MTATVDATPRKIEQPSRIRVGAVNEIENPTVVSAGRHGIAVFIADGKVYAVDNRCPHMGFPLHRGSVRDGILTCHWHHARFDLESGGTFDPWADDVRTYRTTIEDGVVYVDPAVQTEGWEARWKSRLRDGMEQNLNLLIVKAVLALHDAGSEPSNIVKIAGQYGARYRARGWASGQTILAAMANMLPHLRAEDQVLALYHGIAHVSRDCAGQPPHFRLDPLPTTEISAERLKAWFRGFIEVRDRDGAERTLLTAIEAGLPTMVLADMLLSAATDHVYLDGGHTLDFITKACEMLDLIGWQHADEILPSLIPTLTTATRSEELNTWRHPIDLVAILNEAMPAIEETITPTHNAQWAGMDTLADIMLGDDPHASVTAILDALRSGTTLQQLTRTLSYAAALRVAKFHTSNEFADWIAVLHTFTYANALHQTMKRVPTVELARGILHGAMRLYLDRFLNMPAARLPEHRNVNAEPTDPSDLLDKLLALSDQEQRVNESAVVVHRYLSLGNDPAPLIGTLGHMLLREDAEFHTYQMLEAGTSLFLELSGDHSQAANRVLVAVARYLAAHAPTSRAMYQAARTAMRLHRGDAVYEAAPEDDTEG